MIKYIWMMVFAVFISSVSQVILKKSAMCNYRNKLNEYINLKVLSAYLIFMFANFLMIYSYKYVQLSIGPVVESLGYVFILLLGRFFLNEKITYKNLLGIIIIILGIIIFSS